MLDAFRRRGLAGLCLMLSLVPVAPMALAADRAGARASITAGDLQRHVDALANDTFEGREAGSRGGSAAGIYLGKEFQRLKLSGGAGKTGFYQTFGPGYRNILAMLPGSDPELKKQIVLVGAHYDHVGYGTSRNSYGPTGYIHNGADDNASGTAGLVELAEAFAALEERPKRTILFALWDAEEKGLLGSQHWMDQPTVDLSRIVMTLNMDMIGRLRGEKLEVLGSRTAAGLRQLVARQNEETDLILDFKWEIKEDSDHWSFYRRGLPFVMLHTGLHPEYHRPSDDAELVNTEGMERVMRLMFGLVDELANRPDVPGFRAEARRESPSGAPALDRPEALFPSRLGIAWASDSGEGAGVAIARVERGSPAAIAGLRPGDRLVTFQGEAVTSGDQLRRLVFRAPETVAVGIIRAGSDEPQSVDVKLAGRPLRTGISWRMDPAEPGAVILTRVASGSPAESAGLKLADRIYEIGGRTFSGMAEFAKLLEAAAGETELLVERQGRIVRLKIDLPATSA